MLIKPWETSLSFHCPIHRQFRHWDQCRSLLQSFLVPVECSAELLVGIETRSSPCELPLLLSTPTHHNIDRTF